MLDAAIAINQFQLGLLQRLLPDISEEGLFVPAAGHGHPPVWILGHLALVGELGSRMLGGRILHPEWLPLFGPGSSDRLAPSAGLNKSGLAAALTSAYSDVQSRAATATVERLAQPHGLDLFRGTPIQTVEHAITLLLTNHFGFHLAQLSSCRREAGHRYVF